MSTVKSCNRQRRHQRQHQPTGDIVDRRSTDGNDTQACARYLQLEQNAPEHRQRRDRERGCDKKCGIELIGLWRKNRCDVVSEHKSNGKRHCEACCAHAQDRRTIDALGQV